MNPRRKEKYDTYQSSIYVKRVSKLFYACMVPLQKQIHYVPRGLFIIEGSLTLSKRHPEIYRIHPEIMIHIPCHLIECHTALREIVVPEKAKYCGQLIGKFPYLRELRIDHNTDITVGILSLIHSLRYLKIGQSASSLNETHAKSWSSLTQLKILDLTNNDQFPMKALKYFTNLTGLDLLRMNDDIQPVVLDKHLSMLTQLTHLSIGYQDNLTYISVARMTNLTFLDCRYVTPHVKYIAHLKYLDTFVCHNNFIHIITKHNIKSIKKYIMRVIGPDAMRFFITNDIEYSLITEYQEGILYNHCSLINY